MFGFFPLKSKNPPDRFPWVTWLIIVANLVVFFVTQSGLEIRREVVEAYAVSYNNFSLLRILVSDWLHGDPIHVAGNMWFLAIFGMAVEGRLGWWRYLLMYVLAGVTGSILHLLVMGHAMPNVPSLGASGAVMGCLGAALWLFPHGKVMMLTRLSRYSTARIPSSTEPIQDWDTMWVGMLYIGLDLMYALLLGPAPGVAHLAHLGGAGAGVLIPMLMRTRRDSQEVSTAKHLLADTGDLYGASDSELEQMAAIRPNDLDLAVEWAHACLRSKGHISLGCRAMLKRLFPQMLERTPIARLGVLLLSLPSEFTPETFGRAADRAEQKGEPSLAVRLWEAMERHPQASEADRETALFQSGVLQADALREGEQASRTFRRFLREYPMSPLAESARARLERHGRTRT